ncbi:MAG: helix-turn-helix transcriptional regulator [Chloroflexi bacterium]|nr:helix-turn-helix transcriptional regulator [Chloroflexota bacterium]
MLEIGKAIRIIRQAKGLKQNDLAKAAEVSVPFLCLVESGGRQPSLAVVRAIARSLGIPSEALILLAQPSQGTLRSEDGFALDLAEKIRLLVQAQEDLRARILVGEEKDDGIESNAG